MSATQRDVIKTLKARLPKGVKVWIDYNKTALTTEQKAVVVASIAAKRLQQDQLSQTIKATPATVTSGQALLDAAQFVVDVRGDPPSIDELATAVAAHKTYREQLVEAATLSHEIRDLQGRRSGCRYTAYKEINIPGLGTGTTTLAGADTLDDLLQKCQTCELRL